MKTIYDVIEKDTKWLIHFLKENHYFKPYYQKLYNENNPKLKPKTFDELAAKNCKLVKDYCICYEDDFFRKKWNTILKENPNLLTFHRFFASLPNEPYTLATNETYTNMAEYRLWIHCSLQYKILKNILCKIKAHKK